MRTKTTQIKNKPDNVNRDIIYGLVKQTPGIHIRMLATETSLSWNTCLHHLRTLEKAGIIISQKIYGKVCYFDKLNGRTSDKAATTLTRDRTNKLLLNLIINAPGETQKEIAEQSELSESTVQRRIAKLIKNELLEKVKKAPHHHIYPTQLAKDLLLIQEQSKADFQNIKDRGLILD